MEILSTRLKKKNTYNKYDLTGLSSKCDWFIYHSNWINITNTDNPYIIFIHSYSGKASLLYFINNLLSKIHNKVKLIVAGEDYTFPLGTGDRRCNMYISIQNEIFNLIDNKLIEYIFVENLDYLHPKLIPIPLGILSSQKKMYLDVINKLINTNRKIDVFCCHRDYAGHKQFKKRQRVTRYCLDEWKDIVYYKQALKENVYKKKLLNSKFCICVSGGGLDPSPRAWQALICGCIPIMLRSTVSEAYSDFPIIYVDSWNPECITKEKIKEWTMKYKITFCDREKLKLDYWFNKVKSKK